MAGEEIIRLGRMPSNILIHLPDAMIIKIIIYIYYMIIFIVLPKQALEKFLVIAGELVGNYSNNTYGYFLLIAVYGVLLQIVIVLGFSV